MRIARLGLIATTIGVAALLAPIGSANAASPTGTAGQTTIVSRALADGRTIRIVETVSTPAGTAPEGSADVSSETSVYLTAAKAKNTGVVRPLDSTGSTNDDGTLSVRIYNSLNYTLNPNGNGTYKANTWSTRFTRLDPQVQLVKGQLLTRRNLINDSAKNWPAPTSGTTYATTPGYAGTWSGPTGGDTTGIFGTANLTFKVGGQSILFYGAQVHP